MGLKKEDTYINVSKKLRELLNEKKKELKFDSYDEVITWLYAKAV
jgi:hypothetical protein